MKQRPSFSRSNLTSSTCGHQGDQKRHTMSDLLPRRASFSSLRVVVVAVVLVVGVVVVVVVVLVVAVVVVVFIVMLFF